MLLPVTVVVVFAVACAATQSDERPEGELQVRERRFASTHLHLCGSYSHQFVSSYPCGPCINCGSCSLSCSTSYHCQTFHSSLSCVSGCCTTPTIMYSPVLAYPSVSLMTTTECVGSCVNSICPTGFTCTAASLCCAFGK